MDNSKTDHAESEAKQPELIPSPENTNQGTERGSYMIRKSLETSGAGRSGVCDKDGIMIAGNHTLQEVKDLDLPVRIVETTGDEWIVVKRNDLTYDEVKAQDLAISDNRAAYVGYNPDVARVIAQAKKGVDIGKYYNANEIKVMVANAIKLENDKKMDRAEACTLTDQGDVQFGDIWQVGNHKIACADNQDMDVWQELIGHSNTASVVITSPPYAAQRKYDKDSKFKPVEPGQYVEWYKPLLKCIQSWLSDDGSYFMNIKPHVAEGRMTTYVLDLIKAHADMHWLWKDEFVWTHPGSPKKVKYNFKNQFEPIYQFCKHKEIRIFPEAVASTSDKVPQRGGKNTASQAGKQSGLKGVKLGEGLSLPGNVIRGKMTRMKTGHPATFPLYVPNFFIRAYSEEADIIVDPFCGSGTSLIAAEINDRVGRGIEISPHYCGLILSWLQQVTGQNPELIRRET